jgi:tetratricopeptide (TPR) repeat protein
MTLAPLIWSPEEKADDAALTAARRWLGDAERPLAQLVAASWLLGTNDESRAVAVLERLQTDRQQRIGWLARAQLWRMRLRTATANDIDRYQGLVEKMPLAIRAGPQYVLGLALEQSGRPTEAALAYLWVPFVYDRHWRLADDALFRAAATTAQAGFADDARSLYRTLVREYPTSPRAAEATRRLRNESNPVPPSAGRGVTKESSR